MHPNRLGRGAVAQPYIEGSSGVGKRRRPKLPSAKVYSHPAAPAGVEADGLDSVPASTTARSKKKGRGPGAAEATRRSKAPREPRVVDDATRKQAQQDSEKTA